MAARGRGVRLSLLIAVAVERAPTATLTVFNRPIVTFRSTVLGVTPRNRAAFALTRADAKVVPKSRWHGAPAQQPR